MMLYSNKVVSLHCLITNDMPRIANPLMVQSLEKARRNIILKSAKSMGAGIRQLSRLTGVSYGIIQKL